MQKYKGGGRMPAARFTLSELTRLCGKRLGVADVACPACGPPRLSAANQRRKVLRLWRVSPTFTSYRCARCDIHGFAREGGASAPDPAALTKAKADAQRFAAEIAEAKRRKARWIYSRGKPISGTPAERYLESRGYGGPLAATARYLPARASFLHAMAWPFGLPSEIEPGEISVRPEAIQAVHITRLGPDGSGKAGTNTDKMMLGTPRGSPIALAPIGDALGLAITEGIEDGLSIHEATGLGVWAAGSASFLPPLGGVIPSYVDFVTIVADPDADGRRFASEPGQRLARRRIDHRVLVWGENAGGAA
jgi:hypothetical protein